eukprot:766521-Hanusia_phi.AAC.2
MRMDDVPPNHNRVNPGLSSASTDSSVRKYLNTSAAMKSAIEHCFYERSSSLIDVLGLDLAQGMGSLERR